MASCACRNPCTVKTCRPIRSPCYPCLYVATSLPCKQVKSRYYAFLCARMGNIQKNGAFIGKKPFQSDKSRCGEMADATDLKSVGLNGPCRFESGHRHPLEPRFTREN